MTSRRASNPRVEGSTPARRTITFAASLGRFRHDRDEIDGTSKAARRRPQRVGACPRVPDSASRSSKVGAKKSEQSEGALERLWIYRPRDLGQRGSCVVDHSSHRLQKSISIVGYVVKRARGKMNASGHRYLANSPNEIDLQTVFEEYRRRVKGFHTWFSRALAAQPLADVWGYESCIRENRRASERLIWKGMLRNWRTWSQPPNPYNHLDRYLTTEQLEEVYALAMGSEQQVDRIIEFIDTDTACDDELRDLAYQFFRRARGAA